MERPARPRRRLRRRRGATAGNKEKENQIPPDRLATCAPPLRLAVERLSGAKGGFAPCWMNLDSQINSLEAVATLLAACKAQATPSLVTLSMRYCALPTAEATSEPTAEPTAGAGAGAGTGDDTLDALVELVTTNVNLETLYLHGTVHEAWKDALAEAWHARGALHRVRNNGQTYLRKVDLAYLQDRTKVQPAWSIRPKKSKKAPKKGKKKK